LDETMGVPAKSRASYEDLLAVPSHQVAEIIDGELRVTPRPAPRHARAAFRLVMRLGRLFDEGDGVTVASPRRARVERTTC
jgi:hypothetical protein